MTGPPDVGHDDHEHHHDDSSAIAQSLRQPEVFAVLYDRYAADVHRYIMRRLGDTAADDLTADTFLVAFRARSRYDLTRTNARPWFYGIAANLIGKQRRTEERALRALARTGHDSVTESWVDHADDRVTAQAAHRLLAGALASLSGGDRHVLLLVAWADLSYQEVAEALAIPVGTVRSRLNRARRKVRSALGDDPTLVQDFAPEAGHG